MPALAIAFPPSYRWWLSNYGGGQIGGDIVYGLDEAGIGAPDLVRLTKRMWPRSSRHIWPWSIPD